jgi:hypothetical protein
MVRDGARRIGEGLRRPGERRKDEEKPASLD